MKKNPFIQGAMIATIGIIISKLLGIIYVIPFYAIIGQKGGALYGYAYTIYNIFLNLSSIGIPLAISRLTSEYNALEQYHLKDRTFRVGKNVIRILSIISFIVLIIFAPFIAHIFIGDIKGGNTIEDVTFVIRLIATAILIVPTLSVTKGYLQGHKYITVSTISQVVEQAARVVIIIVGSYVAIKVLGLPTKAGVGIATLGATFGGLIAYLYLVLKMRKNKSNLFQVETKSVEKDNISTKKIVLNILRYAAPFIFCSLVLSFYDFVDLSTVVKTLVSGLHYDVGEAETVMSIFSTWGSKLNMIVTSIATGLLTSLIPNITDSFVKNNMPDVRNKINRSLQILLYITLPMTLGLSLLATPVWTVFYGYSTLSSNIFRVYIFTALFDSLILTLNIILQSLNEHKRMFLYVLTGFIVKATLNIPLMYLFDGMGMHAGYGAAMATALGTSTSIILVLIRLHKMVDVNYKETAKRFRTILGGCLAMVAAILLVQFILPITTTHRLAALGLIFFYTALGSIVYLFITGKKGIINDIFGDAFVNKILRRFKKVKTDN